MRVVNARAFQVLGLKGDQEPYKYHNYNNGEGFP